LTLLARLQDPGFTPRIRELDELVDLLADEKLAKAAARAIGRLGPAAVERLLHRLEQARPPLRAHIVRAMGRFTGDARAVDALLAALGDGDPKTRRNAAIELGHVARPGVQQALLQAWERDPRP
jgi:HEAT repeat protein